MGNEVVPDVRRDENDGERVDIQRLITEPEDQVLDIRLDDYEQIHNLVAAVAEDVSIPEEEITMRVNRMIKHTAEPSLFIVLRVNRVIRGLIISETGDTANTAHVGWLRMEVHPWFRGEGYGEELLYAMFCEARLIGLRRLEITSYADNPRARQWFLNAGFEIEGQHKLARLNTRTGEYVDTYTLAKLL